MMEVIVCQYLSLPQQPSSLAPVHPSHYHTLTPSHTTQTLQFIKTVVESVEDQYLLATLTPLLLGHMTSCLLACDVCPVSSEPPAVRGLG